jgi:isopentenyl-diphosphate delta-isomerase
MVKGDPNSDFALQEEDLESSLTRKRKIEHIEICLEEDVQSGSSTMLEDIHLIHNALPEINKDSIDLATNFLGLRADAPIMIAAMTGGHPQTYEINKRLAEAAEEIRVPIGVGSQRAAIEDPSLSNTFSVVRESAPSVPIVANIGATHANYATDAIEMINADILAIHLNPLQEAIQPEGDCDSESTLRNIAEIIDNVDIPVIIKETGAGISSHVAKSLEAIGVEAVDIGGVGGTSWSAVEFYRAKRENNEIKARLGRDFWNWGIPTALSVILVSDSTELEVVATGGIRTGLDVAKVLSLGASAAGVAYPLLNPAVNGSTDDVISELEYIIEGLKVAMYLTGCRVVEELTSQPLIIRGELVQCLKSLDIDYREIASGS